MTTTRGQTNHSTAPMSREEWAIARYNWYRASGLLDHLPQQTIEVANYQRSPDPPPPKPHLKWYPLSKPDDDIAATYQQPVASTQRHRYSQQSDNTHPQTFPTRGHAEKALNYDSSTWSRVDWAIARYNWYRTCGLLDDLAPPTAETTRYQRSPDPPTPKPHLKWYPLSKSDDDATTTYQRSVTEIPPEPLRRYCQRAEHARAGAMIARYQAEKVATAKGTSASNSFDPSKHPRAESGQFIAAGGSSAPMGSSTPRGPSNKFAESQPSASPHWHLRPAVALPPSHTIAAAENGASIPSSPPIQIWSGGDKETPKSRLRAHISALSRQHPGCTASKPFLFDTLTRRPTPFNTAVPDSDRTTTAISFYDPVTKASDTVDFQTGQLLWHESGSKETAFVTPKQTWLEAYQAKAARMQRLQEAMVLAAPNKITVASPSRATTAIVRPSVAGSRAPTVSIKLPATAGPPSTGGLAAPPASPRHYSVAFQVTLDSSDWRRSHKVHLNRANAVLDSAIRSDPEFAKQMEKLIPGVSAAVAQKGGRDTPPEHTWHHATIGQGNGQGGTMQLVPTDQHQSGSSFSDVLHPNPRGGGGYAEWAIPAGAPRRH